MEVKKILVNFPLYETRNAEHYELYSDVFESVPQELAEKYHLTPIYSTCVNLFGIENDCHLRNRGYKDTAAIEAADRKVDELFMVVAQTIETATLMPIEAKAEAGKRLSFYLKPYRNAHTLPYAQETANIRDFVLKMAEEANAADIETLGLTEMMTLLDEANKSFNALYKGRSGEIRVRSTSDTMKTIRPKVDAAFSQLFDAINGMYIVNELTTKDATTREELGKVIDDINSYLIQLQKTLIRAGVIGGKTEDKDTPDTPEEPVTPEITAFYPKENANPDKPLEFPRNKTAVLEGKGLKLVDSPEGKKAQLVLINYVDQRMPHEDSAILLNTDEKIEFTMMYDAAEGQYNFQIETYSNGTEEAVIIKYPETITLV